jgi:tartrate-resistant acid phosphatase type 5
MKYQISLLIVICSSLTGCKSPSKERQQETISADYVSSKGMFQFYVFGDWGRSGEFHQKDLAELMNKATAIVEPEFIISTGDNIYPEGVASTQDPLWRSSYEDIYTGHGLHCPWYVVLGNHDYAGNVQAEIDYSKISRRWHMPSRYYAIDQLLDDDKTKATFVFIDTNPLNDEYYEDDHRSKVITQDTTRQLKWIDSVLTASNATWKFVIGHHPLYTGGKRVEDKPFVRHHLEKLFKKHKVDAYFCGHEHDLQYIKPEGPTHYFVSGSGSEVRPTGKLPFSRFAESIQGFMTISLNEKQMSVQVLDYKGNLLYKTEIKK